MRAILVTALLLLAQAAWAADNEKFVGSNVDARTLLAFKAPQAAVEKLLPAGWEINPPAAGPSKGFNLGVILIDQLMAQDPDGKPVDPVRGGVLVAPVKKTGTESAGIMVLTGLMSPAGGVPGAYGVYALASPDVERTVRSGANGISLVEESWQFTSGDDRIGFQIQFARGSLSRSKAELKVFSAAKPDFYRIYRVEQAADVVRSTETGADLAKKISFKASGPRFAPLFDGTEQLVSVTSIPWYARQVYLPGS